MKQPHAKSGGLQAGSLALMLALLAGAALWRAGLAASVTMHATIPQMLGALVVHWRRLDEFVPWTVLGLLLLSGRNGVVADSLGQVRAGRMLAALLAAGIGLTGLSIAMDQFGWGDGSAAGFAGLTVMALGAMLLSGREMRVIVTALQQKPGAPRRAPGGVTILDLWRFAAAQWGLLSVAAALYIAATVPHDDRLGKEAIRNLLFIVPAAGALPSALMAAGISWWDKIVSASAESAERDLRAAKPRVRAWVVAFLLNTIAGLLLVLRNPAPGIPGAVLEALSIAFYLAGFPNIFWRGLGGKLVLLAWAILLLALAAFAIERSYLLSNQSVSPFFSSAWRQLWTASAPLLLLGMGTRGLECLTPRRLTGMRGVILLAAGLLLAGTALTTGILLLNATRSGEVQVAIMQWLIAGTLPTAASLVLCGMVLWRSLRISQASPL